jgi:predicted RNase H-like HicB family nuclease
MKKVTTWRRFRPCRGCHTQAKTLDTLMKRVREVIELCIEDGDEVDDSLELVGIQRISV